MSIYDKKAFSKMDLFSDTLYAPSGLISSNPSLTMYASFSFYLNYLAQILFNQE